MNAKMTFPELVEAVAAATSSPKRVSEIFLKELFATVADTLRSGENVRVRNLGLFKLTNVESRKSVNVNTGEEMEIPSHRKVTFVPEKSLADAINMPFASFETVVLEDDLTEDDLRMMSSIDDFDD
ncbi:MAG: HU family DNA-binding protein, partial [Muribaculaceae bacterium]